MEWVFIGHYAFIYLYLINRLDLTLSEFGETYILSYYKPTAMRQIWILNVVACLNGGKLPI